MIDMSEWANGSHNSFGDAIYMAALTTVLVFAVLGVIWRAGRRLALRATHRIPRDAQPLLEDTKFVICLALVSGIGLLLTLNPGFSFSRRTPRSPNRWRDRPDWRRCLARPSSTPIHARSGQVRVRIRGRERKGPRPEPAGRIRRQGMALRPQRQTDEGDDEMNPEANPMPLVSECNPVDAVECPCCLTVFRVRTLMTDGNGRLMRDEYETIPMFCPMCGGRLEQSGRKE